MRHKEWLGGLVLLVVVAGACNSGNNNPPPTPATAATPTPSSTPPPPTATTVAVAATTTAAPKPAGEQVTVARIIDGDTFELTDGRQVRVLGIDSCEMSTYGGKQAKSEAEEYLPGQVTLTAQPGVDKDRYNRLLRYVTMPSGDDFGVRMVRNDHTGVYQGRPNDASPQYLQSLYAVDLEYALNPPAGRNCADPYPPAASSGGSVSKGGDRNDRDGSKTGGYCGRKWWC